MKSFEAFVASARSRSSVPKLSTNTETVNVCVATCSGAARISELIQRRLSLIFVSRDVDFRIAAMREAHHAGVLLGTTGPHAFRLERGWDDWESLPLQPLMLSGRPLPEQCCLKRGFIEVGVRSPGSLRSFERHLHLLLEHRRFDVALLQPDAVRERFRHGLLVPIAPRYSMCSAPCLEDCARATDLYVFDPWIDLVHLTQACAAAAMSCADHVDPIT